MSSDKTPKFSLYTASMAVVLGAAVSFGWLFDIEVLKQPLTGLPAMSAITAASFVMFGGALVVLFQTNAQKIKPQLAGPTLYILSVAPLVMSVARLAGFENRMSVTTAVSFILISIAMLLIWRGNDARKIFANILVGIVLLAALFAIIGYSYNVTEFKNSLVPMAVHSAFGFVFIGLSLLVQNSQTGYMSTIMSNKIGGTICRVLIPMTVIFAALIGYTRLLIQAEIPLSIELGVSLLLTVFVSLFVVIVINVAGRLNVQDEQRMISEDNLSTLKSDLEREVVQRKEELDTNERRYRALIDQSIDGITLTDANSNVIFQSPSSQRITGYTLEERAAIKGYSPVHPDDLPILAARIGHIKNNPGSSASYLIRAIHKDGHYYWVEGVATNFLHDPDIAGIVNNFRDVTQRKLDEERVAHSERHFRRLIENSGDAITLTDANLVVLYQSPSVERMTGISLEHRHQNPNVRYTYHEDAPMLQKLIEKSRSTPGKAIPFTSRINHLYGHQIWIEGVITNLLDDPDVGAMVFNYRDITERRNLEEQQTLLASMVNSSSDAIISKSLEGIITSWNRGAQRLFGYTPAEAIGESIMILLPPELRKEEATILARIRNGELVETFETRRIKKDGTIVHMTLSASPIRNGEGVIIGASHISHDITERLESERKLQSERSMLRTLIDNIPDYIYVKDRESRHIINNQAMLDLVGASSENETLGKSSLDFFGKQAAGFLEEDKRILQSGQSMINFEESAITRSGEQKYLLTTKVPLKDEKDEVIGIVGISRDVTNQKKTELDLRTSKYFLERAQLVASIGHWTLEAGPVSTSPLYISTEACSIFECDPKEFGGRLHNFLAYVHPEDLPKVNKAISLALVNQIPYKMDHRIVLKNGVEKWVHVQTEVTHDQARDLPVLLGILQDITERKKTESEILALNADLEKKVSERTSQLEVVNKELEAFSYSVSHDLRAPLRIIDGFATILLEDAAGLDEKLIRNVKTIARNANRMSQLIDDLLNFSRLGRRNVKVSDVNMRVLVDQVLEEFQSADTIRNAKITINEIDDAHGDSSLLKQVWVNLISNAIKYSSKKENAQVEIGMVPSAPHPTWYVKDNGAGFSMNYASKLFGVFQRLHKQDEFDGTGVGLALVQRIIVRHGGRVWAEARLNEGATFFFTLEGAAQS